MTIEQAIIKAQENGLIPREITLGQSWIAQVLLLPEFWQALGKAMGWTHIHGDFVFVCFYCGKDGGANSIGSCNNCGSYYRFDLKWLYQWHRFIDALAQRKSIEDFFKDLE